MLLVHLKEIVNSHIYFYQATRFANFYKKKQLCITLVLMFKLVWDLNLSSTLDLKGLVRFWGSVCFITIMKNDKHTKCPILINFSICWKAKLENQLIQSAFSKRWPFKNLFSS